MKTIKNLLLPAFFVILAVSPLFSLDFTIRPGAFGFFPAGYLSKDRYITGGGGDLGLDADFSSIWSNPLGIGWGPGIEAGFAISPLASGAENTLQLYSFGAGANAFYYPSSRLLVRLDGVLGAYRGVMSESAAPGFWLRIAAGAGFRFIPSLTVAANVGFRKYLEQKANTLDQGLYLGLSALITFETGARRSGIYLQTGQDDPVYPVFLSLYRENPTGSLQITNNENSEIRNVRISFRADNYTASELMCGTFDFLARGRSLSTPLYADFSPNVLNFTENGRITGEVIVRYTLLGRERETIHGVTVQIFNRNLYPDWDAASIAAFVSPNSPEILEFSRYITGLARPRLRTGLNNNMQLGIWLFEGLRAGGIGIEPPSAVSPSGSHSYTNVQFPAQTLVYHTGPALDTGLLYGALLEAAGIRAGILSLGENSIIAFDLGILREDELTEALFNGQDNLLILGDQVWLPLAISKLGAGFSAAWAEGIKIIDSIGAENETDENPEVRDFIVFENAWAAYPPAPLPPLGVRIPRPEEGAIAAAAGRAISRYTADELEPKIRDINRQLGLGGASAALYNQLGNLQVRSNRLADAKTAFERAAGMGLADAMANRGNVALVEKDFAAAERWFRQALNAEPDNSTARRGMELVDLQRGN